MLKSIYRCSSAKTHNNSTGVGRKGSSSVDMGDGSLQTTDLLPVIQQGHTLKEINSVSTQYYVQWIFIVTGAVRGVHENPAHWICHSSHAEINWTDRIFFASTWPTTSPYLKSLPA